MDPTTTAFVSGALAVTSALVYTAGLAFQQKGNLRAMELVAAGDGRGGWRGVVTQRWWYGGMSVTLLGFVLHGAALNLGSLVVVQPLQVTQLVFMLPFSAWVTHTALVRRDGIAVAIVMAGLAAFLVLAQPTGGVESQAIGRWVVPVAILLGLAAALAVLAARIGPLRAALLGAATGVLYGLQGATLKQATDAVVDGLAAAVASWAVYATIVLGVGAVIVQNLALRSGRLSSAQTTLTVMTPVASVLIGLWVFDEALTTDPVRMVGTLAAVVVTVVGTTRLARSPALLAADI